MITVGREVALGAGVENLHWVVARAEDLNAPEDAFELITIGEVFHRFDRVSVARRALAWLKLSGHLQPWDASESSKVMKSGKSLCAL